VKNGGTVSAPADALSTRRYEIRDALATPEAIYGTILFLALLAVSEDGQTSEDLFFRGAVTSVSIWAAHTIAVAVASHGARDNRDVGVRESFRRALDHSYGILLGPLLPTLVLLLGTFNLVGDYESYLAALALSVAILGALGYIAMSERRASWYVCLLSAFLTACMGLAAATLKGLFSH
jgi:hypothetical protein